MNKKGFTLIETVIAVVILAGALIILYTSFTKLLQSEKKRVEYDDVAFIYRTYYSKNYLKDSNLGGGTGSIIDSGIQVLYNNQDLSIVKLDSSSIPNDFNVEVAALIKKSSISSVMNPGSTIMLCDYNNITSCEQADDDFTMYLHSINVDINCNYVFVIKYKISSVVDSENINRYYYGWVGVN